MITDINRAIAAAWPDRAVVQEALAQITWYHNIAIETHRRGRVKCSLYRIPVQTPTRQTADH